MSARGSTSTWQMLDEIVTVPHAHGAIFTCPKCGSRTYTDQAPGMPDWVEYVALKGEVQRLRTHYATLSTEYQRLFDELRGER